MVLYLLSLSSCSTCFFVLKTIVSAGLKMLKRGLLGFLSAVRLNQRKCTKKIHSLHHFGKPQRACRLSNFVNFSSKILPEHIHLEREPTTVFEGKCSTSEDGIYVYYHPDCDCMELQLGPQDDPSKRLTHSFVPVQEPATPVLEYLFDMLAMIPLLPACTVPKKILLLGLGGGSLVHYCRQHFPDAHLEVVEIDDTVISVAKQFFHLPPDDEKFQLHHQNAIDVIAQKLNEENKGTYDLIINDAVNCLPSPLLSPAMFANYCYLLRPQALFIQNMFTSEPEQALIVQQLLHQFYAVYTATSENNFNALLGCVSPPTPGEWYEPHPLQQDFLVEKAVWQLDREHIALEVLSHLPKLQCLSHVHRDSLASSQT